MNALYVLLLQLYVLRSYELTECFDTSCSKWTLRNVICDEHVSIT